MAELHTKAQRFTIQTPIRYREVGGRRWFEGITENISRSGVLFRADLVLEPKAAVQMSLSLPVKMSGKRPAKISCRGTVVRTALTTEPNLTVIGATIRRYRFRRAEITTSDSGVKGQTGRFQPRESEVLWNWLARERSTARGPTLAPNPVSRGTQSTQIISMKS
jgi:hypothetical protein